MLRKNNFHYTLMTAFCMVLIAGCASTRGPYTTSRDKTAKGAGIGAAVGALAAILDGKNEADEILARAAIGAVLGAGVGVYMDAQEEKIARIPGTTVERIDKQTLLINFDSDILFEIDSADLDPTSRNSLDQISGVLKDYPKTAIVVQGHTDSTGSERHNQALSERRSDSVRRYLIGRSVASERLISIGYGEKNPVASNDTTEGKRLNRRVDILLKARAK